MRAANAAGGRLANNGALDAGQRPDAMTAGMTSLPCSSSPENNTATFCGLTVSSAAKIQAAAPLISLVPKTNHAAIFAAQVQRIIGPAVSARDRINMHVQQRVGAAPIWPAHSRNQISRESAPTCPTCKLVRREPRQGFFQVAHTDQLITGTVSRVKRDEAFEVI